MPGEAGATPYAAAWSAINRLIRRGLSWSGNERHVAFWNLGDGRFIDVSTLLGLDFPEDGRATALVDWDRDGDQDLVLTNRSGPRVRILANRFPSRPALALRLVGAGPNTDAIGARVTVELESGRKLVATRRVGSGFMAQSSAWLVFGLGAEEAVNALSVRWPLGETLRVEGVDGPGRYVVRQSSGTAERQAESGTQPTLTGTEPQPPARTRKARVVLAAPVPLPRLTLETPSGKQAALFGIAPGGARGTGRPLLLNLWASWCAPCHEELREFVGREHQLKDAGLQVLAVSVDEPEQRATADRLLNDLPWPFSRGYATEAALTILDTLEDALLDRATELPVPTSFLIDAAGNAHVVYFGPVDPEQLVRDLALLDPETTGATRLAAAVPFEGRWIDPPTKVDLGYFEGYFERRGLADVAQQYSLGQLDVQAVSRAELQLEFGRAHARQGRFEEAAEEFQKAITADPSSFEAHRDLAVVLHQLGRLEPALASYRTALNLRPADDLTRFNLALAALAQGDRETALTQLETLRTIGSPRAAELQKRLEE